MSIPTLAIAVLALTTPDACRDARELAETIADARDAKVSVIDVLEVIPNDPLWINMTALIYSHPELPPIAIGVMTEKACRDAV